MKKYKLGIFGIGTMGQAILNRVLSAGILLPSEIALYDLDKEKSSLFPQCRFCEEPQEIADGAEVILFAVKPQHYPSITSAVRFSEENTVLSIMAGVQIATLRRSLSYPCPIARVMPNTPCRLGKGVCALCFDGVSEEKQSFIKKILGACGETVMIEEKYFDAVTSVSGSGPAYVYMFIEGMIRGGMNGGLTYDQSKALTLNTLIGAAEIVRTSTEELPVLIDKVCSKGGTTIQAVNVYREKGLEEILTEGIDACRKRSEELSRL